MTDASPPPARRGADFRTQWRLALSANGRKQRNQRGRRRAQRQAGPGMVRIPPREER